MTNNTEILRTEGLKRSYLVNETKIDVLKGINLTINNQEFIAIMGKSGSGKTTLLKLLGLLDRPTEGKVFFKGEDSNSLHDAWPGQSGDLRGPCHRSGVRRARHGIPQHCWTGRRKEKSFLKVKTVIR